MTMFNLFCRRKSANFVLRAEGSTRKVVLGLVDDIQAGDLRVTCDAAQGYLSVARFKAKGSRWDRLGGFWDQGIRPVPLPVAMIVYDAIKGLRLHEAITTKAVMLKTDASMRSELRRVLPATAAIV